MVFLVLAATVGLIGLSFVFFAVVVALGTRGTDRWGQAEGKILHSEVVLERSALGTDSPVMNYTATLRVRYSYSVDGQEFIGQVVNLASMESPKVAYEQAKRYPVGAEVVVHYEPEEPGACALELESPVPMILTMLGIGIVCLTLAAFVGWQGLEQLGYLAPS
jgi:hypothetical protein